MKILGSLQTLPFQDDPCPQGCRFIIGMSSRVTSSFSFFFFSVGSKGASIAWLLNLKLALKP